MLKQLELIEQKLPFLLSNHELWQGLFINYEKPFVERVWCQWNEYRINLHRILSCKENEAFFHPHPWPSAMKILQGTYKMSLGHGPGLVEPSITDTFYLSSGSSYEMIDPDSWHSVCPLDKPVMSVMITGKPWQREMPKKDKIFVSSLGDTKQEEILYFFIDQYPIKVKSMVFIEELFKNRKVVCDFTQLRKDQLATVIVVSITNDSASVEISYGGTVSKPSIPDLKVNVWHMDNVGYLIDWLELIEHDAGNYDADRLEINVVGDWKL